MPDIGPTPLGPVARGGNARLAGMSAQCARVAPTARRIAQRRFMVAATKWSLPVFALLLLGSVALWPEIARLKEQGRMVYRRVLAVDPESGRMLDARYRGVDQRGRPFTVTATAAQQTSADRIALTDPKGDVITESGMWVMAQSKQGVFLQHRSLLDMSHDVLIYRQDGTTLATDTAAIDLKAAVASSNDKTHAEGPFGTLDAQGFTFLEGGTTIQFYGPAHLVMNGAEKP